MEATAAHPRAMGEPLSIAWLHVCGVCVCPCLAKGGGANGGLATTPADKPGGMQASHLIPRTPLAQSVVLENRSPTQPQDCQFGTEKLPHWENLCQLWSGGGGWAWTLDPCSPPSPQPHLEQMSTCGCGPYLTQVLAQCYSQLTSLPPWPPARITGMCVLFAPVLFALGPLCWGGGPSSQLPIPQCHHLTLRRKISELPDQDGSFLLASPTFEVRSLGDPAPTPSIAAYWAPSPPAGGMDRARA